MCKAGNVPPVYVRAPLGFLLGALVVLGFGAGADSLAQEKEAGGKKAAASAAPVATAGVKSSPLRQSIQLPGSVEAVRRSRVATLVAGLVVELPARDGDFFEKGETLARLGTVTLEARRAVLEAQAAEADARLRGAEVKLRRAHELFDAGLIPPEQLDDSRSEAEALAARSGSLLAQIAEIDLAMEGSVIGAPFARVVVAKLTEVGEWVGVGDPLLELIAVDDLEVPVDVPEAHLSKVRLRQPAGVALEALPGLRLNGSVCAVGPAADAGSRTFPVKVSVDAANGRVRPGMAAIVSFALPSPRDVLLAPKDALVERPAGWVVFVVQADGTVKETAVRLGGASGAWAEVSGDLAAGARVVVLGNERLRDGQSVSESSEAPSS